MKAYRYLKIALLLGRLNFKERWKWWKGKPFYIRMYLASRGFRYGFLAQFGYYDAKWCDWDKFMAHSRKTWYWD